MSFLENIKLCSRRLWENIQTLFNKGLTGVERTGVLAVSGRLRPVILPFFQTVSDYKNLSQKLYHRVSEIKELNREIIKLLILLESYFLLCEFSVSFVVLWLNNFNCEGRGEFSGRSPNPRQGLLLATPLNLWFYCIHSAWVVTEFLILHLPH